MAEFRVWRCGTCGLLVAHEPVVCRECGDRSVEPEAIDGRGTVYASTVIRVPGSDAESADPFSVCLVDVGNTDTVRVTGRIKGTPDLETGDDVVFVNETDDAFVFELAAEGA